MSIQSIIDKNKNLYNKLLNARKEKIREKNHNKTVVVLGRKVDKQGLIKNDCIQKGMKYICVDIKAHPNVDIVINSGDPLPFKNKSINTVCTSACVAHDDPLYWVTFKEISRILKNGGIHSSAAPLNNGPYYQTQSDPHPDVDQSNYRDCPVAYRLCPLCLERGIQSHACTAKYAIINHGIKDYTKWNHFTCHIGSSWNYSWYF